MTNKHTRLDLVAFVYGSVTVKVIDLTTDHGFGVRIAISEEDLTTYFFMNGTKSQRAAWETLSETLSALPRNEED